MVREHTRDKSNEELIAFQIRNMGYSDKLVEGEFKIRQLEAFDKATKANEKLSKQIYALTWVIGLLTAISAALTFSLWVNPKWQGLYNILGISQ